jgi:hypothetical protein
VQLAARAGRALNPITPSRTAIARTKNPTLLIVTIFLPPEPDSNYVDEEDGIALP